MRSFMDVLQIDGVSVGICIMIIKRTKELIHSSGETPSASHEAQ
jgi:hypothetical protein